ncbi:MAG TPA: pyruvate kinase [Actinomycetota bacterium]
MTRATKLVCTLGPASAGRVLELVEAGMDVARINLTHGTREDHEELLRSVREASREAGRAVAVMTDLSGPKVRLGELEPEEVRLEDGNAFVLRGGEGPGDARGAPTSHAGLAEDLEVGDRVLLSDGVVELRVEDTTGDDVRTRIVRGGLIRSRAGVNVPSGRLSVPAITETDERDLAWVRSARIDLVAQSFVRHAAEVRALADLLRGEPALLVAKIETRSAVEGADGILEAADAVMVARGDLGVELPRERIPVIQKDLVDRANRSGVPAVVATQMLESMTGSRRPTRAEASDVAGAAFDGAAAILLSAETAIGRYPVEAARTAAAILETAEREGARFISTTVEERVEGSDAWAVADAAATAAADSGAVAVACFTRTGLTARLLSGVRLPVPVYAYSHDDAVVRRLTMFRGVHPRPCEPPEDTDAMLAMMDRRLREEGLASSGDPVVLVASTPVGRSRTNLLKVHRVG